MDLSSYLGELLAIKAALTQLLHLVNCGAIGSNVTVFFDSQSALQAFASSNCYSGQFLIYSICQKYAKSIA